MAREVPALLPLLVIGDSPRLLAELSSRLAISGRYLPLVEGPRLTRPDADAEVIRRTNAAARLQPRQVLFAGLPAMTREVLASRLPRRMTRQVEAANQLGYGRSDQIPALKWGTRNLGLGLLRALQSRQPIEFEDAEDSPSDLVPSACGHLVLCEDGNELAQVIAANYAYSIGAGMCLIPAVPQDEAESILERFYSAHENRYASPTQLLTDLKADLRKRVGTIEFPRNGAATFVAKHLPWGFAFPEVPSTHLFSYPDLGISILNGVLAEQPLCPGTRVATFIDPGAVDSCEITSAISVLTARGVFSVGHRKRAATVHRAAHVIEHFPYDLLLISTHCGDAPGWRWTYKFADSEGRDRTLIVDLAIGVEVIPGQDDLRVTEFEHYVSLDGVDWNDPEKRTKVHIGTAMIDYLRMRQSDSIEPVSKDEIPRVLVRWL